MNFKLKHMIFPARRACRVVIEAVFPTLVQPELEYYVRLFPFSGMRPYGLRGGAAPDPEAAEALRRKQPLRRENGNLILDIAFPQEDLYQIRLYIGEDQQLEILEAYALEDDLFPLTPYKGDNHMHTYMSDGKESPMYMAAAICRLGCDYCVITDHKLRAPSLLARDFFAATEADFLVIPGEEVHSPDNPVHIINLGGDESVNDWWRDHEDEYRAAVEAEMRAMPEALAQKDRYAIAASQVMFDKIREANGVSVLCHPGWIIADGLNQHEDVTDYLFDHRRFDALELVAGGAYVEGQQLQLAYYQERPKMPILGSSDSHNCFGEKLTPGNYTIVFADSYSPEGIKGAIRKGRAIAGNKELLYGDYRLMKYGYFLLRNFYPTHSSQRYQLGTKMLRLASSQLGPDSEMGRQVASPRPSELFEGLRYPG